MERYSKILTMSFNEPTKLGPRGGQWRSKFRINRSYLIDLASACGTEEFDTVTAYKVYIDEGHLSPRMQRTKDPDLYWVKVNIRQYLYAAVAREILEVVRPGIFRFLV